MPQNPLKYLYPYHKHSLFPYGQNPKKSPHAIPMPSDVLRQMDGHCKSCNFGYVLKDGVCQVCGSCGEVDVLKSI